jgi:hypothetical protein
MYEEELEKTKKELEQKKAEYQNSQKEMFDLSKEQIDLEEFKNLELDQKRQLSSIQEITKNIEMIERF